MSASDQKLHVVMKEMIRVLKIPTSAETTDQSSCQSFKKHSVAGASRSRDFPEFPVDRCCADRIQTLAAVKKWRPFAPRDTRPFRVPREDFDQFMEVPQLPDTARDKIAADSGCRTSQKSPFASRERNRLEESLVKVDTASWAGLRVSCFLQLLSEFLMCSCEADSPVSPETTGLAFQCLDDCLRICMDQFIRVSMMATLARRTNVLEAIFLPSDGAQSGLQSIPLLGKDLFGGRFQETMEAEAKRLEATDKIKLRKASTGDSLSARGKRQPNYSQQFPRKPLQPFRGRGRAFPSGSGFSKRSREEPKSSTYSSGTYSTGAWGRRSRFSYTPRSKTSYGSYGRGSWCK